MLNKGNWKQILSIILILTLCWISLNAAQAEGMIPSTPTESAVLDLSHYTLENIPDSMMDFLLQKEDEETTLTASPQATAVVPIPKNTLHCVMIVMTILRQQYF